MNTPLRVLIVEDLEDDALLMVRELKNGGYDPVFERVDTATAMKEALDKHSWDAILADYSMPHFSTLGALTVMKETGLDLPFIIVSGSIGEETAVTAMRAGAHDYIFKDNLKRLVPAVERELYEADVRKGRKKVEHDIGERIKELTCLYRLSQLLATPNATVEGMLKGTVDLVSPGWQYPGDTCVRIILEGQEYRTGNFRETVWKQASDITVYGHRIGTIEVYYLEEKPEIDEGPFLKEERSLVDGIAGMLGEMIERKRAEERLGQSEENYRNIVELAPDGIVTVNTKGVLTSCNTAFSQLTGFSKEEIVGKHFSKLPTANLKDIPKYSKIFGSIFKEGKSKAMELSWNHKNGTQQLCEFRANLMRNNGTIIGLQAIVRDVTERKQMEEERKRNIAKLLDIMRATIGAVAMTTEVRDPYTAGHQRRVTDLACAIAREMSLPEDQIEGLRMAAMVHDIGKIYVPAEILSKPGQLNDMEFGMIKMHPQAGYDILKNIEFPWPVAQIVLQHHERLDGSGYPSGISGDEIILEARIIAVADVVEAISSHRPYRPAIGIDRALDEISKKRCILYSPQVVDVCLKLVRVQEFKFD
jgi:PAS domain S-box-containing protein